MNHYTELLERAQAKGIKTFADVESHGIDFVDMTGESLKDSTIPLYWCDAATMALEVLAELGDI